MSENERPVIIRRVCENDAPVPVEAATGSLGLFNDERDQVLEDTIVHTLALDQERERMEREAAITAALAPLQCEVAELRGKVATLLAILGGKAGDNVVDLPRLALRERTHVA